MADTCLKVPGRWWRSIACTVFLLFCAEARAAYIEVLAVEANTGAAAGGHTALRLGDEVFHYQFFPDERFMLVREPWSRFRFIYNRLRNRPIHAARCRVSAAGFGRIRDQFTAVLATQQYDRYQERVWRERAMLMETAGRGRGRITVAGLGFFDRRRSGTAAGVMLRSFVSRHLGADFLTRELAATEARLQEQVEELGSPEIGVEAASERLGRLGDLRRKISALDLLQQGFGLAEPALTAGVCRAALTPAQTRGLAVHLERLKLSVVSLLPSDRPDGGEALVLQLARCQALLASIESGFLLTLDPYPDDAAGKEVRPEDRETLSYLTGIGSRLAAERTDVLNRLAAAPEDRAEGLYLLLEQVNGKSAEIAAVLPAGGRLRLAPEHLVPGRGREVELERFDLDPEVFDVLQRSVRERRTKAAERSGRRYRYRLFDRNCVTELLRTLNGSFASREEAEEALGGWIDPAADRVAVPHDFFYRVLSRYRLTELISYPSRRLAALEELSGASTAFSLWLREGNTLSSTLYRPRPEDTPFLFFTDQLTWPRPFLGMANLVWAAGHGIGGIFALPADNGALLNHGLRGMLYSLPELVYANIRKGTYRLGDSTGREGGP